MWYCLSLALVPPLPSVYLSTAPLSFKPTPEARRDPTQPCRRSINALQSHSPSHDWSSRTPNQVICGQTRCHVDVVPGSEKLGARYSSSSSTSSNRHSGNMVGDTEEQTVQTDACDGLPRIDPKSANGINFLDSLAVTASQTAGFFHPGWLGQQLSLALALAGLGWAGLDGCWLVLSTLTFLLVPSLLRRLTPKTHDNNHQNGRASCLQGIACRSRRLGHRHRHLVGEPRHDPYRLAR